MTGTYQHVGNIDGDGTTQIKSGSDLAANRIIQSALVMGGNGERLSLVTIAASDASGNPLRCQLGPNRGRTRGVICHLCHLILSPCLELRANYDRGFEAGPAHLLAASEPVRKAFTPCRQSRRQRLVFRSLVAVTATGEERIWGLEGCL